MRRTTKETLVDSVFNEFVYTVLFNASYEEKRALPARYLKMSMSERSARNFAANSSKEEKEIVLAYLGYEFCYILNGRLSKMKLLKDMLPVLQTGKRAKISKEMSERGIYVTTDRELMRTVGLMSSAMHHPSYYLDLEILRQGYSIKKWSKRYVSEKDNTYRNVDEMDRSVARLFSNCLLSAGHVKELIGCTEAEIKIMLSLYASNIMQPTDEQLKTAFHSRMSKKSFADSIRSLMDKAYIHRFSGEISITGLGIKKVNNFMAHVIHSNTF